MLTNLFIVVCRASLERNETSILRPIELDRKSWALEAVGSKLAESRIEWTISQEENLWAASKLVVVDNRSKISDIKTAINFQRLTGVVVATDCDRSVLWAWLRRVKKVNFSDCKDFSGDDFSRRKWSRTVATGLERTRFIIWVFIHLDTAAQQLQQSFGDSRARVTTAAAAETEEFKYLLPPLKVTRSGMPNFLEIFKFLRLQ